MTGGAFSEEVNERWVEQPQQSDGSSCGVMVIAHVYAYLKNRSSFQREHVSLQDVTMMRLRLLWMIVTQPSVVEDSAEDL